MAKKLAVAMPAEQYIILPRNLLDRVKTADANQLKLLYWLYAGNAYDASEAAKALSMSPAEADIAAAYWQGAGILTQVETAEKKVAAQPQSGRPTYDAGVIADAIENNADFRQTCDQISDIIGKVFNRTDYNTFYYLYDYCGLSGAFLITTAQFCINFRGKKDIRYISGTALSFYDDGYDTVEKLDRRIAEMQKTSEYENRVRVLCGLGERELTQKEKDIIADWFLHWNMQFDVVRLAFEKSVSSIGTAKLPYMNGIIEKWHSAGFTTAEEITANTKSAEAGGSSFDADEFFTAALKKSGQAPAD